MISEFQQWLAQLNLDRLSGLLQGAIGMLILNRIWDYLMARRTERRELRLDRVGVLGWSR